MPPSVSSDLSRVIAETRPRIAPVISVPLRAPQCCHLDLSASNPKVVELDITDTAGLTRFIDTELHSRKALVGVGGYNEKRGWYARSGVFAGNEEIRSIHLGVDIWAPARTEVFAPLEGTVHSFKDNAQFGDYGPTIILEHSVGGIRFYSLFGHLSRESLVGMRKGRPFQAGDHLAEFGAPPINGDWPPHLHFQLILDMRGLEGDYPGVAAESKRQEFLSLCPDPNLLLESPLL